MKTCSKCKENKSLDYFNKQKSKKDGFCPSCKECAKKYREENKEKISIKRRDYRKNNKEKLNKQNREYRGKNKEQVKKTNKKYYENNKENILDKQKEYSKKNKEKISSRGKEYYKKNKDEIIEKANKRVNDLSNYYIKANLKNSGYNIEYITPEIIQAKREIIKIIRLIKQK